LSFRAERVLYFIETEILNYIKSYIGLYVQCYGVGLTFHLLHLYVVLLPFCQLIYNNTRFAYVIGCICMLMCDNTRFAYVIGCICMLMCDSARFAYVIGCICM